MIQSLATEELTKIYGQTPILKRISIQFTPGTITGLIGPNGAGKSTFLSIVSGLIKPSQGKILVNDQELPGYTYALETRSKIGFIAHESGLYGDLNGYENLWFTAQLYGISDPDEKVKHFLQFFDLWEVRHLSVNKYSRGMRQRLSLSRVMITSPDFLLLDEPFEGLDARNASRLEELIRDHLKKPGFSILVSHDMYVVARLCTRIGILDRGRLKFFGDFSGTRDDLLDLYTKTIGG
jgi:ABC-2 type transport system ATP-binding protein